MLIVNESDWKENINFLNSLEHYGVKGMKWYQHLFGKNQSHAKYAKDTSGSKKVNSNSKEDGKVSKKETRAQKKIDAARIRSEKEAAQAKSKEEKVAAKKEANRKKIMNNPRELYKHRDEFTYEEIQKAMNKFNWEQQLNRYALERDNQFKQRLNNGAEYINIMFRYANNGINLYNASARIINTMQGDDTLPFVKQMSKDEQKSSTGKQDNKTESSTKTDKNKKK